MREAEVTVACPECGERLRARVTIQSDGVGGTFFDEVRDIGWFCPEWCSATEEDVLELILMAQHWEEVGG